jgi:hypothetical protein
MMKAGCPLEKGGLDDMFMDVTEMVVRGNHLYDIRGHSSCHACVGLTLTDMTPLVEYDVQP